MSTKVRNSLLLLTQSLSDVKANVKHLLEESLKYTNEQLYVYISPLIASVSAVEQQHQEAAAASHQMSISQTAHTIQDKYTYKLILRCLYQHSFKLNPDVRVTCLMHNVHNASVVQRRQYSGVNVDLCYELILTDRQLANASAAINSGNDYERLVRDFCSQNIPSSVSNARQVPLIQIDCAALSQAQPQETPATSDDLIYANLSFENTIMGGTFDRLHPGHKIMLSEAVLLTHNRLLIGITTELMLKRKKLAELIEPIEERSEILRKFLATVAPYLQVNIVPIDDPYGPSITEPDYQVF
jgi:hypothetical protein